MNEYKDIVAPEQMLSIILDRQGQEQYKDFGKLSDWYEKNYAEPGPNNLARHKLIPGHCIGHGSGAYDLIVGNFS